MSAEVLTLPDLGEGLTEAEILTWLVSVGDRVGVDQPVAEVETAKASLEVPCPYAGTVAELHGAEGEVIAVGAPLVTVSTGASETSVPVPREESGPAGGDGAAGTAGSGAALVGYGTGSGASAPRRYARGADGPRRSTATGGPSTTPGTRVRVVSPLVRRLAREHGIDVASVRGTREGGLVPRRDVEAAARAASSGPAGEVPGTHRLPLRGAHRAMAERLARSRREIPEATVWVDADATGLLELRRELNEARPDRPVSVLALVARFALAGLVRYPELNAHFDSERGEAVRFDAVHLGFAAQTPRGLVVPVVRDAHRSATREPSARLAEATEAARSAALGPEALRGGTFTVNN